MKHRLLQSGHNKTKAALAFGQTETALHRYPFTFIRVILLPVDEHILSRSAQRRAGQIEGFIKDIESRPLAIAEFDEKLWLAVIDQVTVNQDGAMTFRFKNGSEVTA